MANFARICIATNFLLGIVQAAVLYQHPVDVTVRLNDWAQFNCTVNCTCADNVGWYKAGYQAVLRSTTDLTIPSITVMEPPPEPPACTSGRKTYFFSVLATEALNNSAIYCAAYTDPEIPGCQSVCISESCYSRPALLTVVKAAAADTITLSTTSRIPEITPSPSSFPTQEATSPAVVTLTTTVTSSPTNCPTIATTTSSSSSTAEVSSVAAASARITFANVMVLLAGLVIGSILL